MKVIDALVVCWGIELCARASDSSSGTSACLPASSRQVGRRAARGDAGRHRWRSAATSSAGIGLGACSVACSFEVRRPVDHPVSSTARAAWRDGFGRRGQARFARSGRDSLPRVRAGGRLLARARFDRRRQRVGPVVVDFGVAGSTRRSPIDRRIVGRRPDARRRISIRRHCLGAALAGVPARSGRRLANRSDERAGLLRCFRARGRWLRRPGARGLRR